MNITGNANLTLAGAVFNNTAAVNTVNAQNFTGNLNITLTNSGAANIDVAVTGGKGNDRADFSAGFDKNDAFDGGDGTDTLALTNGVAVVVNPADFGTVKNVEILEITNGGTDIGASVLDLEQLPRRQHCLLQRPDRQ
jgi:Ca2+-binding RTX toxin-like protein